MSLPRPVSKVSQHGLFTFWGAHFLCHGSQEPFFTATIYNRIGCDLFLSSTVVFSLDYAPAFSLSLFSHIFAEGSFAHLLRGYDGTCQEHRSPT
jgi:hypothetical protein